MPAAPEILFLAVLCLTVLVFVAVQAGLRLKAWAKVPVAEGFRPSDALVAVLLCGLIALMTVEAVGAPAMQKDARIEGLGNAITLLLHTLLVHGTLLCIVWVWLSTVRVQSPSRLFGLGLYRFPRVVIQAVQYLGPALVLALGLNALSIIGLKYIGIETPMQATVDVLQGKSGLAMQMAAFLQAVVLAPVLEEFLFRGLLFGSMKTLFPVPVAVVLNGLLFGAVHMNAAAFLPLTALGMAMAVAFHQTKCLWVSVTMHMIFNLSMSLLAIYQSLQIDSN